METVKVPQGNGDSPKGETPKRRTPTDQRLHDALTGTYQGIGGVVVTFGFQLEDNGLTGVGTGLINQAETLAEAWVELGNQNPKVKKALQRFTEASAAGTVIALHLSVLTPLLMDRGILPGFNFPPAQADSNGDIG